MTVDPTTEQIKDYAEHSLPHTKWTDINEHLFTCEDCYQHFLRIFQASRRFPIEIDMEELAGLKNYTWNSSYALRAFCLLISNSFA
jgi:hypothetical protein